MPSPPALPGVNLAVLSGALSRPAERRTLPKTGVELVTLDLTVRAPGRPADTVPVAWFDAPAWADTLDVDDRIVVVGRVNRRFFRHRGGTASRTEVVAASVVRAGHPKRAAAAVRRALDHLAELA